MSGVVIDIVVDSIHAVVLHLPVMSIGVEIGTDHLSNEYPVAFGQVVEFRNTAVSWYSMVVSSADVEVLGHTVVGIYADIAVNPIHPSLLLSRVFRCSATQVEVGIGVDLISPLFSSLGAFGLTEVVVFIDNGVFCV
jgi:hypothetical protein